MKMSKKQKTWKRNSQFIRKQKALPLEQRNMGNAKPNCYTCIYAGYIFNTEKQCFEPYCTKYSHQGKIQNLSITKWNDSFDKRQKEYEQHVIYHELEKYEIA